MKGKKNFRLIWFFIIITAVNVHAQNKLVNLPGEEIIKTWMEEYKVPVVGVGVIESGKIKEIKVFGNLNNVQAPVNTIFNAASITKPVVAMLTLKLVSMGQWNLDEPLAKYWVDPDVAKDPRHKKLTTYHVLTHQSGLPNWRGHEPSKKLAFAFEPGTGVKYSGEGFEYLREALEHKFNRKLEELSDSLLFKPYGMNDTHYYWDKTVNEFRYAGRHDKDGKAYEMEKWEKAHAANLLLTTIEDYAKFGVEVMKGTGLSNEVLVQMITPQAQTSSNKNISFGLAWLLIQNLSDGEYALGHSGMNPGLHTIVILLPDSQRGIVIMTNGDNGDKVYNKIIKESLDVGNEIMDRIN